MTRFINNILIKKGLFLIISFFILSDSTIYANNKRAFLVGISEYNFGSESSQCFFNNIHGANDIMIISPTLQKMGFKITSLINRQATASNIRLQLKKFSSSCKSGDIVYIHFSCHGQPIEDVDGDESDGWDEALIPVDAKKNYIKDIYSGENHITDDELNRFFRIIRTIIGRKGYLTVIIDACHAGTSYRGEENEDSVIVRGTNIGFSKRGLRFVPKIDKRSKIKIEKSSVMSGICLIEACRSYQLNNEIKCNGKYYGSLS